VSLALRSRASGSDSDYSRPLAAWLIHAYPQCIKSNSPCGRPVRVMPCLYSLGLRSPSRLSPSALCSHANHASCPSVRTPPLAPTLSTCSAVKPDVPNYVGLDYTEYMPEGLSACPSSQLPMFSRLRRYAASTTSGKLPGTIAPRLQTSLLVQTQARRSKHPRVRTLFAHFVITFKTGSSAWGWTIAGSPEM
jgi:hypothetical protein